jgi:hypothetical protein
MNLLRTVVVGAGLALGSASLSSCLTPPDYPLTPEIDFKEVQKEYTPRINGEAAFNTLTFLLDFRDGDGDLGLGGPQAPASDAEAPYLTVVNGHRNRDGYNYYIQPFKKNRVTSVFERFVITEEGEFDGRYPRLNPPDSKEAPLKGELRYTLVLTPDGTPAGLSPGDELRFEISIRDRTLHESNKITTSSIILGP